MRLFGIDFNLPRLKAFQTVNARGGTGGWLTVIGEAFAGAWQSAIVQVDSERDVLAFSGVFACVTLIANDISKMRLKLVAEGENGICQEVPASQNSPFARVLARPNHYQNRIKFIQQWVASKLIWGNVYVLKERDASRRVVALYVLDPQRVTVLVTPGGDVYYRLSGDDLAGIAQSVTVPAPEIIHDLMCPLWHPLVGVSPIYACGRSATMGARILRNSTAFFQNASLPAGILTAPGKIEDADAKEMKRRWDENYSGENRGKVAVLGNGLKFEPMGAVPAHEAQLIEQLRWSIEDVARCYHVPAFKVGGPIPPNMTVEALNQNYYSECLQVQIEEIELALTEGLGMPAEKDRRYSAEFDLEALLRMDSTAMAEVEEKLVGAGIKSPDEARRRFNLQPVPGGATPYMQQQNYSLAALAKRDAGDDPFGKSSAKPAAESTPQAADDPSAEEQAVSRFLEAVRKGFEEVTA